MNIEHCIHFIIFKKERILLQTTKPSTTESLYCFDDGQF